MTPLTLEEFAQELRRKGDFREAEFADEILQLITLEEDVAEPYSNLCYDLERYAADFSQKDDAAKALEWIGDRSNLLAEIEKQFKDADREGDADDVTKQLLAEREAIAEILEGEGWNGEGDIAEALRQTLASWPPKLEYDL